MVAVRPCPPEPEIRVNGALLTPAQAMAVRVACGWWAMEMAQPEALGSDPTGRAMAEVYRLALAEVNRLMAGGRA